MIAATDAPFLCRTFLPSKLVFIGYICQFPDFLYHILQTAWIKLSSLNNTNKHFS